MNLTPRDQRTVRIAVMAIGIYLVLFLGWRSWRHLEGRREAHARLLNETLRLKRELQPYENRVLLAQKLKETYHLDPQKLAKATLVAQASAAIQSTARAGGVQVGPIRESPARSSNKELTSMQLEGVGPVPAVMTLLHQLETLGFPLILDAIQLSPDAKPGMLKINLTIVILDFEQWKNEGVPHV